MAIALLFLLGIVNFTTHKAVLESGHPMLALATWPRWFGGRLSLIVEYVVLVGTMLLADGGATGWVWAYLVYSVLGGLSAWLIVTRRL